jgi:hypothetical protein
MMLSTSNHGMINEQRIVKDDGVKCGTVLVICVEELGKNTKKKTVQEAGLRFEIWNRNLQYRKQECCHLPTGLVPACVIYCTWH